MPSPIDIYPGDGIFDERNRRIVICKIIMLLSCYRLLFLADANISKFYQLMLNLVSHSPNIIVDRRRRAKVLKGV